jgi:predicted permease
MHVIARIAALLRAFLRSGQLERDLDDEIRAYADDLTARNIERGMTPQAARRSALVEIGGVEQVKERLRDVRIGFWLETFSRDVIYGLRTIRRTPGFACVVIATLALCIGANVTMFSVMNAVLWRQLPYPEPERLVVVDADYRGTASAGISDGEAIDLLVEPGLFDHLATIWRVDAHLTSDGEYEQVAAASATDDALNLLGAVPLAYGRPLEWRRDHGADGFVRAVVISNELWRRRFNADPAVIGRQTEVNNLDVEIVGVLRPGFRLFLPANAAFPEIVDVWFPRPFENDRRTRGPVTIARLARGVSLAQAHARVETLAGRFSAQHTADYNGMSFRLFVRPLHDVLTAGARPALWALTAAVWFVLVIGCVNIANLMLARARVRAPEIAMRRALGASRARLTGQFFTEAMALAIFGAAAGLLLAFAGLALVEWFRPVHLPRQSQITIDGAAAIYTAALTVLVSLAFGILPSLSGFSTSSNNALRAGRANVQRAGNRRLQRAFVVAEVALSIVPLVAAGLMIRTFVNLANAPIGFNPEHVVTAKVGISVRLFRQPAARVQLYESIMDRVRRLPGIEAVSAGGPLPLDVQFIRTFGRVDEPLPFVSRATMQSVLPGYLAITGVKLREGRDFTIDDVKRERPVVVIDERIAKRLFPNGAVGQRLALDRGRKPVPLEIIGVTNAVRMTRVDDDSLPHLFLPYDFYGLQMPLVIKTAQPAAALAPTIKQIAHEVGTRRPIHNIRPMQDYVDMAIADTRFTMLVLAGFAAASLLLAGIGLYGTLAYLTAQRTQEFGVRMALGASAGQILRSVAREGLWMSAIGGVVGIVAAAAVSSSLRELLYEVTPFDATTLAAVGMLVGLVSLLAALYPAWRAAGIDPAVTLRAE